MQFPSPALEFKYLSLHFSHLLTSSSRLLFLSIEPACFASFHFASNSELCWYPLLLNSRASSLWRLYKLWISSNPLVRYPLTECFWSMFQTNMCISACSPSKWFLHMIFGSTIHMRIPFVSPLYSCKFND
jgi:hypothetical protein